MGIRALHAAALTLAGLAAPSLACAQYDYNVYHTANATNYCQAFTPGISNTIRNRAAGVENVGTSSIAVACSIDSIAKVLNSAGVYISGATTSMSLRFTNGSAQPVTIPCTALTGSWDAVVVASNKTLTLDPGASGSIFYSSVDTGENRTVAINFNCTLAPNVILSKIVYVNPTN